MDYISRNRSKTHCLLLGIAVFLMQGCQSTSDDLPVINKAHYDVEAAFARHADIVPLVIIGSGPAGLGAATYGAPEHIRTLVIEGGSPGGLLMYTTKVENWPGEVTIQGPDIIKKLKEQALARGAEFVDDVVEKIDLSQWPYKIELMNGEPLYALTIVIATGSSPRKLSVPGEEEYWGHGVTACAKCDAIFYAGEDVVVVGGGDKSVEEALQLANHVRNVTILVRKGAMRASESMQERLKDYPSINIMYNVQVEKIVGDGTRVTGVEILNNTTNELSQLPVSGVFLAVGNIPNSDLVKGQLDLDTQGFIITRNGTHMTRLPGVVAAGEVADTRYQQGGSSWGRGCEAAIDALWFLKHLGLRKIRALAGGSQQEGYDDTHGASNRSRQSSIAELTSYTQLVEQLPEQGYALVQVYSPTCQACTKLLPLVESLSRNGQLSIELFKADADKAEDIVKKFYILKVPCLLFFKDGVLLGRYNEPIETKEKLNEVVNQMITQR